MALYIVQFEDKPNVGELRDKLLKSHFEFLDRVKETTRLRCIHNAPLRAAETRAAR